MAIPRFSPGTYVLVRRRDVPFKTWPGFICTEKMVDMVAEEEREGPRNAFEQSMPVLLIGTLRLVWATEFELDPLDPPAPNEQALAAMEEVERAAYREIFDDDNYFPGIEYWSSFLKASQMGYVSDSSVEIIEDITDLETCKRRRSLLTPSMYSISPKKIKVDNLLPSAERGHTENLASHHALDLRKQNKPSGAQRPTMNGPPPSSSFPSSRTLEPGNEPIDRDWATFFIGEKDEEFRIPYQLIFKFACFRDVITDEEERGYCVRRPAFRNIKPGDFLVAANFMESGDFVPLFKKASEEDQFVADMSEEETKSTAITQCVRAWKVASELVLEEMLELLVRKFEALQLSAEEVLWVSYRIFAEPNSGADADYKLRDELALRIAKEIYPDPDQASYLIEKMLDRPLLEIAVLSTRLEEQKTKYGEEN